MATKADMKRKALRILEVEKAMAIGMSYRMIQIKFAETHKVSERQIRGDVFTVQKRWAEEAEKEGNEDLRRNQTRQLLRQIVRSAMANKSYSAAVAGVGRLMELDGLKTIKVEHSGSVTGEVQSMTSNDKLKELESLMQKANDRRLAKENGASRTEH